MKKFTFLVTLLLLCLSGCHQESAYITTVPTTEVIDYSTMAEKIGTTGNYINGTTSGNIAMGMGAFACSDGHNAGFLALFGLGVALVFICFRRRNTFCRSRWNQRSYQRW